MTEYVWHGSTSHMREHLFGDNGHDLPDTPLSENEDYDEESNKKAHRLDTALLAFFVVSYLQIEIDKYSQEQIKNIDPIDFWRQNKENYPGLFFCFTCIFTMQASSVPSESLFSEAGDQVTDKRNRLDPDRVNKMMVVEDYYKSRRV